MTRAQGRNTFDSSNTRYNIERILAALVEPKTYAQLCAELHMTNRSARRYLTHLRAEPNRRVYIKKFMSTNGCQFPLFALGSKPDAKKTVKTNAEFSAQWRAKMKVTPELRERATRYEAARWAAKKALRTPTTWFSALGVVAV
jgi:hypothetical protein